MTEQTLPNDWLLKVAQIGCLALRWLLLVVLAVLALMIPYIIFGSASDLAEFDMQISGARMENIGRISMVLLVLVVAGLVVIAERLLKQLQLIIESVGDGDPFIPENAHRLTVMAWLLLASQIIAAAATTLTLFEALSNDWDFSGDYSVEGIFAVVLLFILARVFRHGAAMREDLEGTI